MTDESTIDWAARLKKAQAFLKEQKPKPGHHWAEKRYEYQEGAKPHTAGTLAGRDNQKG